MPETLPAVRWPKTLRPLAVLTMDASPWAPLVAIAGQEHVRLMNIETQEEVGQLAFPDGVPQVIRFSRGGRVLDKLLAIYRAAKSHSLNASLTAAERTQHISELTRQLCQLPGEFVIDETPPPVGTTARDIYILMHEVTRLSMENELFTFVEHPAISPTASATRCTVEADARTPAMRLTLAAESREGTGWKARPTAGHWYLAEDHAFCHRARLCGFPIIADTTIRLWHVGDYGYSWEDAGIDRQRYEDFDFQFEG